MPATTTAASLPVLAYSSGLGWTVLGHARTESAARRIVMRELSDASRVLVERYGFMVGVARRTALQRELNGGPEGFIWDVYKVHRPSGAA